MKNILFILFLLIHPVQSYANRIQLNSNLDANSDITDFEISPDGTRVVYWGDQDNLGVDELYSVSINGGVPTRLNSMISISDNVLDNFKISPDSKYVVYVVDSSPNQLFSVPIEGGTPIHLDTSDIVGGPLHGAFEFDISPDSKTVVFTSDLITWSSIELFSVSITGGTPTQLAPTFPGPGPSGTPEFIISPDSNHVVFRAKLSFSSEYELFSVPIVGGAYMKLNDTLAVNGEIESFDGYFISSDSQRVVYLAEQDTPVAQELYSVPIIGGTSVKLNDTLTSGNDVSKFLISPDGQNVIYQGRVGGSVLSHFYVVQISGGTSIKLSKDVVAGGGFHIVGGNGPKTSFFITSDSLKLIYGGRVDDSEKYELYSVPLTGGVSSKLNGSLVSGGGVSGFTNESNAYFQGYMLSSDGNRIFYFADQDVDGELNLYSSLVAGGGNYKITPTPISLNVPTRTIIYPDSGNLVYLTDSDLDNNVEAIGVKINSGPQTYNLIDEEFSVLMTSDRRIKTEITPNNSHLVFIDKIPENPNAFQLFSISGINDQDNDGVFNLLDNCIDIANNDQANNDGDLLGDDCDPDDDNDDVDDVDDDFPFDPAESVDTDGDNIGNNADPDDDNDTIDDELDNCPLIINLDQINTDQDLFGDVCDSDDDNDGVEDLSDIVALDPKQCRDLDIDSCDDCSIGIDGFGLLDDYDVANDGIDTNSNGQCDVSDPDDDGDTINDDVDNCPLVANADQLDANGFQDGYGKGDACEIQELCLPIKVNLNKVVLICL